MKKTCDFALSHRTCHIMIHISAEKKEHEEEKEHDCIDYAM